MVAQAKVRHMKHCGTDKMKGHVSDHLNVTVVTVNPLQHDSHMERKAESIMRLR